MSTHEALIRDVPDFPTPGVLYKDLTPVLADPQGLRSAIDAMVDAAPSEVDVVAGIESRGFWFAPSVALALGCGFVAVRKPKKLPGPVLKRKVVLEYGKDELAVHTGQIAPGSRVLLVDDVLATGGTLAGAAGLVEDCDAEVAAALVYLELTSLPGRKTLENLGLDVRTVLTA